MWKINKVWIVSLMTILAVAVFGINAYTKQVIIDNVLNVQQIEKASEIYSMDLYKEPLFFSSRDGDSLTVLEGEWWRTTNFSRNSAHSVDASYWNWQMWTPSDWGWNDSTPAGSYDYRWIKGNVFIPSCATSIKIYGNYENGVIPINDGMQVYVNGSLLGFCGTYRTPSGWGSGRMGASGTYEEYPVSHGWATYAWDITSAVSNSEENFISIFLVEGEGSGGVGGFEIRALVHVGIKITKPSDSDNFDITKVPAMPKVDCSAKVVGIDPNPTADTEFDWEATITYTEHGRNDKHTFAGKKILGGNWTPDFKNVIAGGDIKIKTEATIDEKIYDDEITAHIRGTNPNKQDVKNMLGQPILQVICYKESRWRQFDSSSGPPLVNPAGPAFGLMQLTGGYVTSQRIWSWKENIKCGKKAYNDKRKQSKRHVKNERKKYPKSKNLSPEQEKTQVCCMYRAGTPRYVDPNTGKKGPFEYYYIWNPEQNKWVPNPMKNKISLLKKGMNYADDCIRIEADINAGNPPDEW